MFQSYPLDIYELVIGYLASIKAISSISDLESYTFDETRNECHVQISKSYSRPKDVFSDELAGSSSAGSSQVLQNSFVIKPSIVLKLMNTFINVSVSPNELNITKIFFRQW